MNQLHLRHEVEGDLQKLLQAHHQRLAPKERRRQHQKLAVCQQHQNSKTVLLLQSVMVSLCRPDLFRSSTSYDLANLYCQASPADITPPSSTVPSIFAESQTQNQGQPVVATNASRKRTVDQDLESPAAKLRKTAPEPTAQQAPQYGLRVVDGLTLLTPTEPESMSHNKTELRAVVGSTMPSLPEPQEPSQAPNKGVRDDGGEFTFTVPGLRGSQGPGHALNNGGQTFGELTVPSQPQGTSPALNNGSRTRGFTVSDLLQAPVQAPTNGSLQTGSGLTMSYIPEPSLARPLYRLESTHQVPNDGHLRTTNSIATPNLPTPSQHPSTVRGIHPQAQDPRSTVNRPLSQFFDSLRQTTDFSTIGMLCPGCVTSKEGCYPFWLCADCKPDGTPRNPRDAEYQALSQQFRSYQATAKAVNTKIHRENTMYHQENKALTERNQELEEKNIRYMSQARAIAKANAELQLKVQSRQQVGKPGTLAKENQELQQRVHQQQQLITMLRQKTGENYMTSTGEEQAASPPGPDLMPLRSQILSRNQNPANQGVHQSSPNPFVMNRALSPGQNQNAVAMSQGISPRSSQTGAVMGHGRASSQGTIHFPSNQGTLPQSNMYALMNTDRPPLQSSNGVSIQDMSPGRNLNAIATSQTASPRPTQARTAMGHRRASNQAAVSPQPTPHTLGNGQSFVPKASPSPSLSPNGFAVNHTQSYGNGFSPATVGQGSGPNGFARNQSPVFSYGGNGLGMNNGASANQGQGQNVFDGNQGGSLGQADSSYLRVGSEF